VQNFTVVEGTEPPNDLNKNVPDFLFLYVGLALLIIADLLENISVVSVLHY
jgi:hypothetical protein